MQTDKTQAESCPFATVQELTLQAMALKVHLILRDRQGEMSRQLRCDLRAMFDEHLAEHLPENIREKYHAEVVDAVQQGVSHA